MYNKPSENQITEYVVKNMSLSYLFKRADYFLIKEKYFENDSFLFDLTAYQVETINKDAVYYKSPTFKSSKGSDYSIELNIFIPLSGLQELNSDSLDEHYRFKYDNSEQKKHNSVLIPSVNFFYEEIVNLFNKENLPITRKPIENNLIFTHDIDQLRSGWFELFQKGKKTLNPLLIAKALAIKLFKLKDPHYKAFEKLIELNKQHNMDAIYFMMTKKSHKDADHDETILKKVLELLKGADIGLHPGYNTFNNENEYLKQLNKLKTLAKTDITKVRQHFLQYNYPKTTKIQQSLNLKEDHTLGYAEQYGFRNNTCSPFYLYDFNNQQSFNIIQYPLLLMDSTLIDYLDENDLNKNMQEALSVLTELKQKYPLQVSILFHNTAFADIRFKGFGQFYERLISINQID